MGDLNKQIQQALDAQRRVLSERLVARQIELQAEIWRPYGDAGWEKSVRDAGYHLSFLAEAILAADAALFVDYVGWVKVLFAGLDFPDEVLVTTLECTRDVLQETLPVMARRARGRARAAAGAEVHIYVHPLFHAQLFSPRRPSVTGTGARLTSPSRPSFQGKSLRTEGKWIVAATALPASLPVRSTASTASPPAEVTVTRSLGASFISSASSFDTLSTGSGLVTCDQ